jgi:D-amino-acid dehydrogenase
MKFDVLVLGAGAVGVSVAAHLQRRGVGVALVDRKTPGSETSFGNAGLIQRDAAYPYAFPRDMRSLLRYATNRAPELHYHPTALPRLLPFLARYWYHSRSDRHAAIARAYATLIEHSADEHRELAGAAGCSGLLRPGGWIKAFRTDKALAGEQAIARMWQQEFATPLELLDAGQLHSLEPCLSAPLAGGIHYTASLSTSNPQALVQAYAAHFHALGGRSFLGDAATLQRGWSVKTDEGEVEGRSVVVALGPWSDLVCKPLGYRVPLAAKRGYHMHYAARPGIQLTRPVLDAERGCMLAPMARGIRLSTGVEMAHRDARPTPAQLTRAEVSARQLLPMGERLDAQPWLGSRPATPDMLPVIGPAPRHDGLWFAFGHAHHGLTLGPVTGRLLAEMFTGAPTVADPHPFRFERF